MDMNDKFYDLPEEKRNRIINAGFRVFAQNSYKKSPMNEIAAEADISKSLLFFYFRNKKEFYLFLLKNAEEITNGYLQDSGCYLSDDIFEMMYKGLLAKAEMMRRFPDMGTFAIKAYYENDPEVVNEVREIIEPYTSLKTNSSIPPIDASKFKEGLDLKLMYRDMYLASEGYLWEMQQKNSVNIDKMVSDYKEIIGFWKKLYLK